MARSFKFSFSRPSRKNSQDSQLTQSYQASDSPWSNPGGKAERVLGPFEPAAAENKKKPSRKERKLQKHPGSMNIAASERGGNQQGEGGPGSMTYQSEMHYHQPLSPLLRPQIANDAPEWDNGTGVSGVQAHRSQSSSTLRSYYDPAKSPLYISQQTSASSARDMALRKGYPQTISPVGQDLSKNTAVQRTDTHESDSARDPQKKQLHLDLSTIFPKPYNSNQSLLSPNKVVRSPSILSVASSNQQSTQGRPRWFSWERKKSRESILSDIAGTTLASVEEKTLPSVTMTSKIAKRASQTWYVGIEEEEITPVEQENLLDYRSERHRASRTVGRDTYLSDQSQMWRLSQQNPNFHLDSAFAWRDRSQSRQSSFTNGTRRTSSHGSQKSVRWENDDRIKVSRDNLQNRSFLILSSSDDEVDKSSLKGARYRRHRIRASIGKLDTGDDVIVCSAERVKKIKPRPIVNIPHRKMPRSKGIDVIPPVPVIPPVRPQPSPRVSSMKWREDMKAVVPSMEAPTTPAHSTESSAPGHPASQLSPNGSLKNAPVAGSKMMAVTEDEEKLLEGMRRKRASLLRKNKLSKKKDSLSSLHSEATSLPRPKTAGEGSCPKSSYFESNISTSPPPVAHGLVGLNGSSYAASADDVSREESFPSSESPPYSEDSSSDSKPPSKSVPPGLSFSHSDIPPSTPPGHMSPLTPPPDHEGSLEICETGIAISHSPPMLYLSKSKHDRNKTLSSSIVVLDGAEQNARQLDEENEIIGWAMDRW